METKDSAQQMDFVEKLISFRRLAYIAKGTNLISLNNLKMTRKMQYTKLMRGMIQWMFTIVRSKRH